jgi:cell wall-associated NlpC family hydrolase
MIDPAALQDPSEPQTPVENEDLIREALAYRGTRYRWGGASRGGFDCSGFALYVYKRTRGINLPHRARDQMKRGTPVSRKELRAGDLVFFHTNRGIGHVGIYIGDNKFIHAANRRSNVRVNALTGWYARHYAGARRLSPAPEMPPEEDPPPPGTPAGREDPGGIYLAPAQRK